MATWRVGRKLGRTLYKDGVCVGMVDSPALAEEIVAAMDNRAELTANRDDWRTAAKVALVHLQRVIDHHDRAHRCDLSAIMDEARHHLSHPVVTDSKAGA